LLYYINRLSEFQASFSVFPKKSFQTTWSGWLPAQFYLCTEFSGNGPGGSAEALYHSLFDKIAKLPDNIKVYPGHNYGEKPVSTIGYEKCHNPYYRCRSKKEFLELRQRGI